MESALRGLTGSLNFFLRAVTSSAENQLTDSTNLMRSQLIRSLLVLLFACTLFSGCSRAIKKDRIQTRADQYFKSGDYEKSRIEYLNLLRVENQSPTALQQIGFIWMKEGAPLQALPFLLKVRELAPDNVQARAQLAVALMAVGNVSDARKEAMEVLQRDPGNSDAVLVLADGSQTKEEISGSEQQLEKFTNKNSVAFHLAKASLAGRKGDMSTQAEELQEAVRTDPKSARAHLALGYAYQLRGNPDHAGPELKTASDLAPPRSEEKIKYAEFEAANNHLPDAKAALQQIAKETPDYLPVWQDLAKIAVTEGDYDQALSLLENLFSRNPNDPDARLLESQVWLAKGDAAKATALTDQIDQNYPNNALIKYTLARTYIASNNLPQAQTALQQAISINPDYVDAVLLLGDVSVRTGKAQNAVKPLEELLQKRPDVAQARTLLANVYRSLGRLDDAAALFNEQIKLTPDSADAYFAYGTILRQQNKNDGARQAFEKASELAPDNLNVVDQLLGIDLAEKRYDAAAQLIEQQVQKHPNTAGASFLQGELYFAPGPQRDAGRAEEALQKAIQLNANFTPAYEALVSVYISENKLPQALTQLKTEIEKNPNDPRPVLVSAIVYEQMKDYNSARDAYQKTLGLSPNSVLALNNLAYLYAEKLDQADQGYNLAQKAHNLEPSNERVADTLAWILYKRGDYQQALALATESAAKNPDNPVIQFHLGMINDMMGDLESARRAFEKAVHGSNQFAEREEAQRRLASLQSPASNKVEQSVPQLEAATRQQPNDVVLLLRLGDAYQKERQYDKAAGAYENVVKLNPKLPTPALKLAQLYAGPLGKPGQALELAKKARDLSPNDPEATAAIGHIALQTDNYTWAYSLLQESVRNQVKDPTALYDLAVVTYAMGKVPEAREAMQRYLATGPEAEQSAKAKQFLAFTALEQPTAGTGAAESEVKTRLAAEPDYVPALMAQAAIQSRSNDEQSAIDTYLKVLHKYPDFAPAQEYLAAIYQKNPEKLGEAYNLAMKARKSLGDDPELARILAQICFRRKEFAYAVQLFEESSRKTSLSPQDLYYLGMAQLQNKQEAAGRQALQRALEAGLEDPLAQDAKKRLAQQKDSVP
jgi:tetratricopeptide (TPR) repeat protein